jgi:hypothetical protein
VFSKLVAKDSAKAFEKLKAIIDGFLTMDSTPDFVRYLWLHETNSTGGNGRIRIFTYVSIISLDAFVLVERMIKRRNTLMSCQSPGGKGPDIHTMCPVIMHTQTS